MLGNYLTTALRLLWREHGYAAINIFGLAVGFCLCLLTVQLAAYQLSVGDFHEKKDRVFRVLVSDTQNTEYTAGGVPIPLGPALKEQLPEVEEAVRFSPGWPLLLRVGDKDGRYEKVSGAEAGVFDMFSLPLLRGDPKTALARPYTMVLTEPLARRLFGESDPIGQVVHVGNLDYEVTGIVGQLPANSLLQVSALSSLSSVRKPIVWLELFRLQDLRAANARCRPCGGRCTHCRHRQGGWGEVQRDRFLRAAASEIDLL